jgi:hypothetical protein
MFHHKRHTNGKVGAEVCTNLHHFYSNNKKYTK